MDHQVQTCVVDAETLAEHIYGIKKLVYDGQIRLLVPLDTSEGVEKIYQKSIKPKPEPKEATRPKSSGRPVKVYPTFDINSNVAREFLGRCNLEDSKLGVEFQQEAEEYTPWKKLREQEEQQKASEVKPAGYAAALLAKLNIKEPTIQAPKAPVKPKLVARSPHGPNGAWKKTVPTIQLDGIPMTFRPILGYTLWRLHERETYSFLKDASIILSENKDLTVAAKKAGVKVQDFGTLLRRIAANMSVDTDVRMMGDVERDFGLPPPQEAASMNGHTYPKDVTPKVDKLQKAENGQLLADVAKSSSDKIEQKADETGEQEKVTVDESMVKTPEPVKDIVVSHDDSIVLAKPDNPTPVEKPQEDTVVQEALAELPQQPQVEAPLPRVRAWADVVSNRIRPIEERYPVPANGTLEPLDSLKENIHIHPEPTMDHVDQEKASTIADWVRMVKANMDEGEIEPPVATEQRRRSPRNRKTEKASPPQEPPPKPFRPILMQRTPKGSQAASDKAQHASEKARSPSPPSMQPFEQNQHDSERPDVHEIGGAEPAAGISSSTSAKAIGHADNKDATISVEQVPTNSHHRSTESNVSSARTMPSRDSMAKSALNEEAMDSDEEVVVFNPKAKRLSAQQQVQKATPDEKPPEHLPLVESKPHHVKHLSVEEPSPRRQRAVEPQMPMPSPARQHRQPKPKAAPIVIDPDAFGRDFASNPQMSYQNPYPRPQPRPTSQHGPPRPISQHGPPRNGNGSIRGNRPFIHPQALPPMQQNSNYGPSSSNGRGRQHRNPAVNVPRAYAAANQNNVAMNAQAAPLPSPRPSPRVEPAQLAQSNGQGQGQGPDPDIDFVLQSGPPRGSVRGRGKLWIPT